MRLYVRTWFESVFEALANFIFVFSRKPVKNRIIYDHTFVKDIIKVQTAFT